MSNSHRDIIPQRPSTTQEGKPKQLKLFPIPVAALPSPRKPQVVSIPGVSPKDPYRYQVKLGGKAIASELTADDAAKLANLIKRKRLTPALDFLEERGILCQEAQVFLLSAIGGGR